MSEVLRVHLGPNIPADLRRRREAERAVREDAQLESQEPVAQCAMPGCSTPAYLRRMPTAYADESRNWLLACRDHHEESDALWEDQWREYYSGLLW